MISRKNIATAKQANLPRVLIGLGFNLIKEGHNYHLEEHDSLKFFQHNGIWLYKWWSRGGEIGDGIQYLERYGGMQFRQAVETLVETKAVDVLSIEHSNLTQRGKVLFPSAGI